MVLESIRSPVDSTEALTTLALSAIFKLLEILFNFFAGRSVGIRIEWSLLTFFWNHDIEGNVTSSLLCDEF
jgi:hypothetical protein